MTHPTRGASEILDRLPPHSAEAERQVLGSILLDSRCVDNLDPRLRGEHFYIDANRRLFNCLVTMHERREAIDADSLTERLKTTGQWETIGGVKYLLEVLGSVAVAAHAAYHGSVVMKHARYRAMIQAGLDVVRDSYAAADPPEEIANRAEEAMAVIETAEYDGEPMGATDCAREAIAYMEQIRVRGESAGTLTGLERFDRDYGGIFPGELTILAARPRVGKTAMACQIAQNAAQRGKLTYFASIEMRRVDLVTRMLCSTSGVNIRRIRTASLNDADVRALVDASNEYSKGALVIQQRPKMDVFQIRRAARRLKKSGLSLVIIDYLQNIEPSKQTARDQRHVKVGQIAKDLQRMAIELDVPVLCLAQVGREVEKGRRGKDGKMKDMPRPMLSDLRESGDIEAAADVVIFLHRKAAGWAKSDEDSVAEMLIDKYRNGTTQAYKLIWNGPQTRFEEPLPGNYVSEFDHCGDSFDEF